MQKAYMFNAGSYIRYDIPADKVDGGPTTMDTNSWKGFPAGWTKVDAALNLGNGKIYMFNGSNYVRFDILLDKVDQEVRPIALYWEGFPPSWSKIDAAVNWGNGKVYMFNDSEYIRYDILQDKVDQGVRPIKGNWGGFPDNWHKVNAVLNWGDDRVYMFNEDMYIRYSISQDRVDRDPKPIKDNWAGFPKDWNKIDDGVVIDNTAEWMGFLIEHNIQTEAVGFAYVIYDNKRLVKSGYGGFRAKPDTQNLVPAAPYSLHTEMGIGSMTKSLTAMALLKCMNDKSIIDAAKKVNVDATIDKYLPKSWPQHGSISTISFRQLLTHTSGIQPNDDDYATLRNIIQMGVGASKPHKYANPNFSLMRVLIPMIDGIQLSNNDASDAQKVADAYKQYVQKNVFEPSGVRDADCRLNSAERAFLYGPPSDTSGAYAYDGDDDSTLIAGAGGWKLSALEFAKVINTFFTTERILPADLRERMMNDKLGCYNDSGCVRCTHNGAWSSNGRGYHNCYYVFNDGVQCVLMTNSTYSENPIDPETVVQVAHAGTFGCCPKK